MSMTILDIDTEHGYDILKIYDGYGEKNKKAAILATMSGKETQDTQEAVVSSKEKMRIIFTSDANINMKGFKATVTAIKKKELPEFVWSSDLSNITIRFPNGSTETLGLKRTTIVDSACIFEGISHETSVIIKSSLSSITDTYSVAQD